MMRRVVGLSVGVWLLVSLSLLASGWDPDVLVLGGIVLAGAVGIYVIVDLASGVRRAKWPSVRNRSDTERRHQERVQVLAGGLYQSEWSDAAEIRSTLLEVMDDRLKAEHDVDRHGQPEAAAALLSPRLQRLAAAPSRRLADPREIRSVLSDIEEL